MKEEKKGRGVRGGEGRGDNAGRQINGQSSQSFCIYYTRCLSSISTILGTTGTVAQHLKSSEIKTRKNYRANLKAKPTTLSLPRSQSYFHGVTGAEINVLATGKLSFSVILMICRTVRREGNDQE